MMISQYRAVASRAAGDVEKQIAVCVCRVRLNSTFPHATNRTIFLDLSGGGSIFQKPFACFCVTAL
jgi:hypothetical protein